MKNIILAFLILIFSTSLYSQNNTIEGIVINTANYPIESISCILQDAEKTEMVKTEITNSKGKFLFKDITSGKYLLTFQHIAYEKELLEIEVDTNIILDPLVLIPTASELSEVIIKGERPIVKATSGKLVYNIPLLVQQRVVTNAFDALKIVPNILSSGEDDLQLVGANEFTILLNGQPTNMNMTQLQSMLKSMSADRIANIEIMYSTPPQYNVRGASINIILTDQKEKTKWQGETLINYSQAHYARFGESINLLYTKPQFNIDFMLSTNQNKSKSQSYFEAIHTLNNGSIYNIDETNQGQNQSSLYNTRLSINYDLKNKDKLHLTYTGEFANYKSKLYPHTQYLENKNPYREISTDNSNNGNDQLHNLRLNYQSHKKLNISIDYTNYKDPSTRTYKEIDNKADSYAYKTWTQQRINKTTLAVDHSFDTEKGWNINYGGNFSYSTNNNDYIFFSTIDSSSKDSTSITEQNEYTGNLFIGFTKSLCEKFSMQLSLSGNYFRAATNIRNEREKTLWNEFTPFINSNLTYNQSSDLMYQLSFSSNVKYPPYWFMSGDVSQMNSYSLIQGNPNLKFSKSYEGQFMFMLKRKYIFLAAYEHIVDRFYQMPYQSRDELKNTFMIANLDYAKSLSSTFIVPFNVSNILNSRIVFSLFHQIQKDSDFHDIPFKRNKTSFTLSVSNTFKISTKPDIKIDITGFYMHGALQGVYDVKRISNISSAIKWNFLSNKAELSANVNDIFNGSGYKTVIDYKGQNSKMKIKADTPSFRITLLYRFNSYEKSKTEDVDTSRFGRE